MEIEYTGESVTFTPGGEPMYSGESLAHETLDYIELRSQHVQENLPAIVLCGTIAHGTSPHMTRSDCYETEVIATACSPCLCDLISE